MSKARRLNAFFLSEKGRKLSFTLSACTAVALFGGNFLPQTLFLDKYRQIVQCYRQGVERELSEKLKKRVQTALDKITMNKIEKALISPFMVYGFDNFYAGSTKYRSGAIIGIPTNYSYESEKDINPQEVRFRNEMIDWNSESGQLLKEALVLKEDEQIFGICKSILQAGTHKILLDSSYPAIVALSCYSAASGFNQRYNFYARPLSLRLMLYSIIGLFGLGIWSFSKDFTQVYMDGQTDKKLCELGPDFIDAGVRYYEKILKKNMALRSLIGDNTYTVKGNENFLVRQKAMPLTIRKSYFEMRLKELKDQVKQDSEKLAS